VEQYGSIDSHAGGPGVAADADADADALVPQSADSDRTDGTSAAPKTPAAAGPDAPTASPGDARSSGGEPAPRGKSEREVGPRLERLGERTEDFVDTVESAITQAVPHRVRHRRNPRQNTIVNVTWRALVLVAGLTLITIGLALLLLPGPGWATILLGLVVLATEYTWANRLLEPVRRRVKREAQRVRRLSPGHQAAVYAGLVAATAAFLALSWYATTHANWSWLP
jgi:uncharacterized protein (TIGR02611 family)